jgi:signal transduction histidine kinase
VEEVRRTPGHELARHGPAEAVDAWSYTVWPREDGSGAITGLMVEVRDRTTETEGTRRLEQFADQIRQINERLLGSALREQEWAEKAEAAARAKSDFLAMMSHELRTPLNGIIGHTEVLSGEVIGPINAKQREGLQRISNCSADLLQLIDDVLTYSRVEAQRVPVRPERVDLCRLARETVALVEPLAMKKRLELSVSTPDGSLRVETDPQMVRQILLNLLGNAVKFTERGSVRLEVASQSGEIRLRVRDTGLGIARADLDRIFEPFVQSEAVMTRRFAGTGLGLPISRTLATVLGGTLTLESTPGEGATFTLHLPRSAPSAAL